MSPSLRLKVVSGVSPGMSSTATACSVCSARCCAEYTVSVIGCDVWNITSGLGIPPEDYLLCFQTDRVSPGTFCLDQSDTRYDIALDKVEGQEEKRDCVFLMPLGGPGRCGIHACRPYVCQTYPAYLDGDMVAIREDVLCPTGAWKLSRMNVGGWRERLNLFQMAQDVYYYVVFLWNERVAAAPVGTVFAISEYYSFLLNAYRAIARRGGNADAKTISAAWVAHHNAFAASPLMEPDEKTAPLVAQAATRIQDALREFFVTPEVCDDEVDPPARIAVGSLS
ncbi:putative Fe-S oxidoreductase [Desulfobacter postgatei 2ac9]|uniref:Putative Fe-S oxidoreductase n=2 Tax=Desulfobacter postgatei TaxID=2293 RepID=I5B7G5_9BACT|nr:putative Fe-S oxidoreductase [Desulfobacter postgatei 2ac9]